MRPTDEELAFWVALRDGDDTGKLALADWLADRNNAMLSHALRWCVRRGHWPRITPKEKAAVWERRSARDRKPALHKLPGVLFDSFHPLQTGERRYRSVRAAISDLAYTIDYLRVMCSIPGEGTL